MPSLFAPITQRGVLAGLTLALVVTSLSPLLDGDDAAARNCSRNVSARGEVVAELFIAVLALPVTTLTRPGDTSQASWTDIAVAAKGKHHKKCDWMYEERDARRRTLSLENGLRPRWRGDASAEPGAA